MKALVSGVKVEKDSSLVIEHSVPTVVVKQQVESKPIVQSNAQPQQVYNNVTDAQKDIKK